MSEAPGPGSWSTTNDVRVFARSASCRALALVVVGALIACAPGERPGMGGDGAGGRGGGGSSGGPNQDASAVPGLHPLAISAQEAVARLAKILWKAGPDADLLKRADSGAIKTREDVGQVAAEMLKDQRARVGIAAFYRWWFWLDLVASGKAGEAFGDGAGAPDPKRFPEWTTAMSADAARQTETFAVNVTFDMNGSFRTLMTGPFTYLNQRLATLYGLSGIVGDDLKRVDLDPKQRGGILTQPWLMALDTELSRTDPPRRGRIVRDRFFCETVPPITPAPPLPPFQPNSSNRQFFEMVTASNPCVACHHGSQLNPLGLPFEGFDQIGRARTVDDAKQPVDVTGLKLRGASGAEIAFDGPVQLGALLTDHDEVQRCVARQWLTFVVGRPTEPGDGGDIDDVQAAFKTSSFDLRAVMVAGLASEGSLLPVGQKPSRSAGGSSGVDGGSPADCGGGAGTPARPGTGPLPEGCAQAAEIFSSQNHGCNTCHAPGFAARNDGGFDMASPGWEKRLVGAGPNACAPPSNLCKGRGLNYLNTTQPATGLFLDKLKPNPPCGDQMPHQLTPLTLSELACIQKWANNVVAGGPGQ